LREADGRSVLRVTAFQTETGAVGKAWREVRPA
jgi:hypothetical protein